MLQRLLTIGGPDSPLAGLPLGIVRTSSGDVIVRPSRGFDLQVFDSTGSFRGNLARAGQGPGEVRESAWIEAGTDDTIRVYERDRVLLFGPRLTFAGTERLNLSPRVIRRPGQPDRVTSGAAIQGVVRIARLSSGAFAVSSRGPLVVDPKRLTIRTRTGDVVASATLPDSSGRHVSYIPAAGRTVRGIGVWLLHTEPDSVGYRILWSDTSGNLTAVLGRRPRWWHRTPIDDQKVVYRVQNGQVVIVPPPTAPIPRQPSLAMDIAETEHGVLHVLIGQPRERWEGITGENRWIDAYSTIIEAVDPRALGVTARYEASGYPVALLGDDYVATYREDHDGVPYIDLWRIPGLPGR